MDNLTGPEKGWFDESTPVKKKKVETEPEMNNLSEEELKDLVNNIKSSSSKIKELVCEIYKTKKIKHLSDALVCIDSFENNINKLI